MKALLLLSLLSFTSSFAFATLSPLTAEQIEDALLSNQVPDGYKVINHENNSAIRNSAYKSFIQKMKTYVEENIDLTIDNTAVSTIGTMQISADILVNNRDEIIAGVIYFHQEGAQHPEQRGPSIISRHFRNKQEAIRAGYITKTGWSFFGILDKNLHRIGYWNDENRIQFDGY